jgi:hypothetical protein
VIAAHRVDRDPRIGRSRRGLAAAADADLEATADVGLEATADVGLEATADVGLEATADVGLAAAAATDASRSGPGTTIRSVLAGCRSWPSDAVLSGPPAGAAGDESSCCVSSSEKVPMQERGVCPLWRRPGAWAGRNPRKPHPVARRVTARAR